MMLDTPYLVYDNSEITKEIQEIDAQVKEELAKDKVNQERLYQLRFQQLMRGIYLTQNPYELR